MKKIIYKNKKFEVGITFLVVVLLLTSSISLVTGINSSSLNYVNQNIVGSLGQPLVPHPIYGYASYDCGAGWAVGANVSVHTDHPSPPIKTVYTNVDVSGAWQVDVGDPGPNWPSGAFFWVNITGIGNYSSWFGSTTGVVSGNYNNMGTIIVYPPTLVAEAGGPYYGVVNISIPFYGNANGGVPPYSWNWDFGDGNSSNEQNPSHVYAVAGDYVATITVTDSCGNCFFTNASDIAFVYVNSSVQANAHGPYNGTICSPVQFTGSASGGFPPYVSWFWDFGDGETSTEQNPLHQYDTIGVFNVTLIVTDNNDYTDDNITTATIAYDPPIADANGPYYGFTNQYVQFNGVVTGGCEPYTWHWDFGDGGFSNNQNPLHIYNYPGNYTVTLNITDATGYTDKDITTVEIFPELSLLFLLGLITNKSDGGNYISFNAKLLFVFNLDSYEYAILTSGEQLIVSKEDQLGFIGQKVIGGVFEGAIFLE